MRRASVCASGMGPGGGEPLIVVEESAFAEEEAAADGEDSPGVSAGSPPCPYLLSPWRDTRKHSLPTPACTSGPTASQVRRLSERGEGAAREAREAAFLATLSQAAPQPGGRRHSVVTISRVPQSLFGRGRRESVAAFPSRPGSIKRRDSTAIYCPPSTENLGSTHNLQLDIMDDIVTSRKVRVRLSGAGCEVTPLGASGAPLQYAHATARRHSDFAALTPPPIPPRRRASELPPPQMPPPPPPPNAGRGIVCTDTDLHTILNSLTSSATEINRCGEATPRPTRPRLATARSTSFDGSALGDCDTVVSASGWLAKRHQTLAVKRAQPGNRGITVTFADEKCQPAAPGKVVWDKPSGSLVDAEALGSAIEVFLRRGSTNVSSASTTSVPIVSVSGPSTGRAEAGWCPPRAEEEAEGCEANICSTLKDLFVK